MAVKKEKRLVYKLTDQEEEFLADLRAKTSLTNPSIARAGIHIIGLIVNEGARIVLPNGDNIHIVGIAANNVIDYGRERQQCCYRIVE